MASFEEISSSPQLPAKRPTRTWGETYLANYNAISAFFWFNIPLRLIQLYMQFGAGHVYEGTADYVRYVQTAAILELVHSAAVFLFGLVLMVGLVRAPIMTTFIQVFSRIFLTWGVVDLFPNSVRNCPAYPVMLVAWSTTEVIRYSFYAWNLLDEVPYPLLWLRYSPVPGHNLTQSTPICPTLRDSGNGRYSTFYVLYPVGVGAEFWTTMSAVKEAYAWNPLYATFMVAVFVGYIPGLFTLYTHMMRQRRKVLGSTKSGKKNGDKKMR